MIDMLVHQLMQLKMVMRRKIIMNLARPQLGDFTLLEVQVSKLQASYMQAEAEIWNNST